MRNGIKDGIYYQDDREFAVDIGAAQLPADELMQLREELFGASAALMPAIVQEAEAAALAAFARIR